WTPFGFDVQWGRLPSRTCDFMEAHGVRGHGFNAFELGGWLLFRFWPDTTRLPFIDIHQAGTDQDLNDYLAMMSDPQIWRALDGRRHFLWAMTQTPIEADAIDADSSFVPVF